MIRLLFLAFAIVTSAIAPAAAQPAPPAPRPVELADYYRVEAISGTALSPDGRTVAFVRTFVVEAENRRHSEIWTVPADGSAPPRRLTNPALSSSAPRWSPDGRTLYYSTVGGTSLLAATLSLGASIQVTGRRTVLEAAMDLNGTNVNWDLMPGGRELLYIDVGGGGPARPRLFWLLQWTELAHNR